MASGHRTSKRDAARYDTGRGAVRVRPPRKGEDPADAVLRGMEGTRGLENFREDLAAMFGIKAEDFRVPVGIAYRCPACGTEWEGPWHSALVGTCPGCHKSPVPPLSVLDGRS